MEGAGTNPFVKLIIDLVNSSAPQLIQKCPFIVSCRCKFDLKLTSNYFFQGEISFNLIMPEDSFPMFPNGIYRDEMHITTSRKKILNVLYFTEMN